MYSRTEVAITPRMSVVLVLRREKMLDVSGSVECSPMGVPRGQVACEEACLM